MKATPDELADIGITNLYDVIMEHGHRKDLLIGPDSASAQRSRRIHLGRMCSALSRGPPGERFPAMPPPW